MPVASRTRPATRPRKERVLIEFPGDLLKRADEAARKLEKNRSELIRTAVEQLLDSIETKRFEEELASAYAANARLSAEIADEFSHVDREGF
ncbi:MAG: ribbon-helix-helix protein, CopG family [Terracidiphilus sp.]|jgi:metal-responsive CopG/Arc/MetJ family transcriptional regulator